jgi:hypothetical protein
MKNEISRFFVEHKVWIEDIQTSESIDVAETHAPSTSSDTDSTHKTSSPTSLQRLSGSIKQHQISPQFSVTIKYFRGFPQLINV